MLFKFTIPKSNEKARDNKLKVCICRKFVTQILNFLDLTRHIEGRVLLDIIFWMHVFFLCLIALVQGLDTNYRLRVYQRTGSEENYGILLECVIISAWVVFQVAKCVLILFLARRSEKKLQFYLRWYTIWNSIFLPPTFALSLYMKWCLVSPETSGWGADEVVHIIIFVTLLLVKTYLIVMAVLIYRKLGTALIHRFEKYGKEDVESTDAHLPPIKGDGHLQLPMESPQKTGNVDVSHLDWRSGEVIKDCSSYKEPPRISDDMFQQKIISPLNISIDGSKIMGEGQFGAVYKGTYRRKGFPKTQVAAKVIKNPEQSETFRLLLQEVKIAISVGTHNNIVQFFGISSDASLNAHFAIITEFCEMGSLEEFLQTNRHTFINMLREEGNIVYKDQQLYINLEVHGTHSSIDLIRFAHQLALGMEHLTSKKIIHGDLAARNVLLTQDLTIKLSDFGMSRRLYNYEQYFHSDAEQKCFPWRWMSYEAIRDLKFSSNSDVWSYGVVLWEIFSLGSFPFEKEEWSPSILEQIKSGLRLPRPTFANVNIYKVMQSCWTLDPHSRPNFQQLSKVFESYDYHMPNLKSSPSA